MVRVTVELVPFGVERNKRTLGVMEIINDGSGDTYNGNYNVHKVGRQGPMTITRIEGFKRRSRNVWQLLARALENH